MDLVIFFELAFYFTTALLLLQYAFVYGKLIRHQSSSDRFSELPFVSIVVCAKNESENLKKFIPLLLEQKYPDFELIVVDDDSSDNSLEVLESLSNSNKKLSVVSFDQKKQSLGKKEVLEYGIHAAKSEILVLTDADCKPTSKYWLLGMVNGFANGSELVLGVGTYSKKPGFLNYFIRAETYYIAQQYLSFALMGRPYMSVGRNVAYKKSWFKKNGGFKSHYSIPGGDDDLLINEMSADTKLNIVYDISCQTESIPKQTWKAYFKQKSRHVSAGLKYNIINKFLLGLSYCITTAWYFLIPLMICYNGDLWIVLTIVVLKKIVLVSVNKRIFSKIGGGELIVLSAFIDIMSIFVQIFAIINSLIRKEGKW